jgi:hypothetical protein
MQASHPLPENLQSALEKGVLQRLPVTFLPFVHQQLHQWDYLFPNERQSVERLLLYTASLDPAQSAASFRKVEELERKMGVREWKSFSTSEQTIENSSLLARSPYFQDWRGAVQAVFDAADSYAKSTGAAAASGNRLILMAIPRPLELTATTVWSRWQGIGASVNVQIPAGAQTLGTLETLLVGGPGESGQNMPGLLTAIAKQKTASDTWIIEAGRRSVEAVLASPPSDPESSYPILLSYERLNPYREEFSREMNTMHKDLEDADAVYDRLRAVNVVPWCPPEVAADPAIREFVRNLFLSGNGAVIFGNSFVEWAASEAIRRARPRLLAAKFGVRTKPKPFTGVAVFNNPDQVNPLPPVDDVAGSSIDSQILALYVWLSAIRYDEYQHSTVCVCVAESISQAYVVAPPEFSLAREQQTVSLHEFGSALSAWMA